VIFNSVVVDTLHWRHLWVLVALIWAGAARGFPRRTEVWSTLGLMRPPTPPSDGARGRTRAALRSG
jgi:hypothetical protein